LNPNSLEPAAVKEAAGDAGGVMERLFRGREALLTRRPRCIEAGKAAGYGPGRFANRARESPRDARAVGVKRGRFGSWHCGVVDAGTSSLPCFCPFFFSSSSSQEVQKFTGRQEVQEFRK